MMERTIADLRAAVETLLRDGLGALARPDGAAETTGTQEVSVTISPFNTLSLVLISPLFRDKDFEEKNRVLWSVLDRGLTETESDRIDFWLLLSPEEAKRVYPATLEAPPGLAKSPA